MFIAHCFYSSKIKINMWFLLNCSLLCLCGCYMFHSVFLKFFLLFSSLSHKEPLNRTKGKIATEEENTHAAFIIIIIIVNLYGLHLHTINFFVFWHGNFLFFFILCLNINRKWLWYFYQYEIIIVYIHNILHFKRTLRLV